ncbi:hypothetical protein WA026_003687 [Henosepilachna vigintioctopunctata]|uniref:Peptidase S1 domain-containing protein n=1 Tax=Henosepilachna vigintioctopunctata TaxID=420089 RepID=A0AAW1UE03_9CUCU
MWRLLINSKTVLTAAHCFRTKEKAKLEEYYTLKLGTYNICDSESTQLELKAEKVKIHELYDKKNPYYDLALVILSKEASHFTTICLPSHPILKRPKEGVVPGLGVLKYEGSTPCTVHESRLLIYPDNECKTMLESVDKNVSHVIKAFCAGYIQGGVDTCQGDSGGPLQIIGNDGTYTILGIVSFGYKCAAPGVLGLYTDVSQHLDWIKKHSVGDFDVNQSHSNEPPNTSDGAPTTDENDQTVQTSLSPPSGPISLPQFGMRPAPFIQFFPVRPMNLKPPESHLPINIFIFNRWKSKKGSKNHENKLHGDHKGSLPTEQKSKSNL